MRKQVLKTYLEYRYSQSDESIEIIKLGLLSYNNLTGEIDFNPDKVRLKELFTSSYPKIKFEIIEDYINLIQNNLAKNQAEKSWNEVQLKQFLDNHILSPDDSALGFSLIKKDINIQQNIKIALQHIEGNQLGDYFNEIDELTPFLTLGKKGQYNDLKDQYVSGRYSHDFHQRLEVFTNSIQKNINESTIKLINNFDKKELNNNPSIVINNGSENSLLQPNHQQIFNINEEYSKDIAHILIKRENLNFQEAITDFETLRQRSDKWERMTSKNKYKILANLGILHLDIQKNKEAAQYFVDALTYQPENENALGLMTLAQALKNHKEDFYIYFNRTIEKNPENENAYMGLILIEGKNKSFEEIIKSIPSKLLSESKSIALSLGDLAYQKQELEKSIQWFERVLNSNQLDWLAKPLLIITKLELFQKNNLFQIQTKQLNAHQKQELEQYLQELESTLEKGNNSTNPNIIYNIGVLKDYLGRTDEAVQDIELALREDSENPLMSKTLAKIYIENKHPDKAIPLLEKLKDKTLPDIDSLLFLAIAYKTHQEWDKAITLLGDISKRTELSEIQKKNIYFELIDNLKRKGDYNEAINILDTRKDILDEFSFNFFKATILQKIDKIKEAKKYASQAFDNISPNTLSQELEGLFYLLYDLQDFQKVIELSSKLVVTDIYSPFNQLVMNAYEKIGKRTQALEMAESFYAKYKDLFLLHMIISNYELIGDKQKITHYLNDYLSVHPDTDLVKLKLAQIYFSQGEKNELQKTLSSIENYKYLTIKQQFQYAYFLAYVGQICESLEIVYQLRKKNINDEEVHELFLGFHSDVRIDFSTEPEYIEDGVAVLYQNERGEVQKVFFVEEDTHNNKLRLKLLRKKIGDTFEVDRRIHGEKEFFTIVDINNKHVAAFQETLNNLEGHFISEKLKVTKLAKKNDKTNTKDFDFIFKEVDKSNEISEKIDELYLKRKIPIGAYLGNPIKNWGRLTDLRNKNLGIYSLPNIQEDIFAWLDKKPKIVLDILSLLTLHSTNNLDLLIQTNKQIFIASCINDDLQEYLMELEKYKTEGFFSIIKSQNQYFKNEISPTDIQNSIDIYIKLKKWLQKNTKSLPSQSRLELEKAQEMDDILGKSFHNSILLAKELGAILFTDDALLAELCYSQDKLQIANTYFFYAYLADKKIVSPEEMDEKIVQLLNLNYKDLPLNTNTLFLAAKKSDFKVNQYPFELAIQVLRKGFYEDNMALLMAVSFLKKLYVETSIQSIREMLTGVILQALFEDRNYQQFKNLLFLSIDANFRLLQKQKDDLLNFIYLRYGD